MKAKKLYYFFLHVLFITGIMYAFAQFITTPRAQMLERRLWAYENWIIISFYGLFVFLTLTERELKLTKIIKPSIHINEFRKILSVLLLLLIFPWGIFILFAPSELLGLLKLTAVYWRLLGVSSLLAAGIYTFALLQYRQKLSYYIFIFGAIDNLISGVFLTILFVFHKVTLLAWSATPLLFYFAYFFREQAIKHKYVLKKNGGGKK